ncbi:MAG: glycosyltransferase family 2 protein [Lutibacter sp.]
MKEFKHIYVIILNYNSSEETISLYNNLIDYYIGIQILVVDNNSFEKEKNLLKTSLKDNVVIFNSYNLGYAGGNNIGIKKAMAENAAYIWLLNPDIQITESTLPILLETIQSNKNIAAVGPRICYRDKKTKIYSDGGIIIKEKGFFTAHLNYDKNIEDTIASTAIVNVDYVNGSVMLLSVPVIRKIGLMLEDFFLYFEETEWCLRASKNNYSLLTNTNAIAYHTSSIKGALYKYYMTRNRILLAKYEKEFYWKTIGVVGKLISINFIREARKLKLSQATKASIKGFLAGLFGKLKK